MKLVKYDAACRAIAEAKRVDEVKQIRDVSIAMRAYARQADNRDLEADAIEIRMRATRRMDQMRQEQKATVGLNRGARGVGTKVRVDDKPTLAEVGIDKNLAHEGRKLGALSEHDFERAVITARDAVGRVVKEALKADDKKERRAEREAELGVKINALPTKRYGVICADPPWKFEVYSEDTGQGRAPENHYSTMMVDAIAEIAVPSIAAEDCVLFLWATAPTLPEAFNLLTAWGFTYRTHCVWAKDKIGLGFWFRNQHEILIVAVKGEVPAPAQGTQWSSLVEAPRDKHSKKPDVFYDLIECYFPNLPKIELFARAQRSGWDVWGNEAPENKEQKEIVQYE